jgi:hypothetical protein
MPAPARTASFTASSASLSEPGIRFPGGGTAGVISSSATVFPAEAKPPASGGERATWVLARRDGRWLIEAYHSCPKNAA